jgi:nucleotide-binding universal stress UspA family protein
MPAIVCGVDGSRPSRAAARLSAAIARRLGLRLVLEHVVRDARRRRDGVAMLERLRQDLDAPAADLRVEVGLASARLAAASETAALVAIGGAGGDHSPLTRSVRSALSRSAQCPVAVVPAVLRLGGRQVVCGVRDWADVDTVAAASRFADALGLPLVLVHVLPRGAGLGDPPASLPVAALERPWDHETAHHLLDAVATAVGAAASLRVEVGSPGPRLAREAALRDAGLLMIGAPSRGAVGAALSGSASAYLMRRCQRPLIVCRRIGVPSLPAGI